MTKEEAIKVLDNALYGGGNAFVMSEFRDAIKLALGTLKQEHVPEKAQMGTYPSLPDNLDEAAEEWCKRNNKGIALCGDKKSHYLTEGVDAFKAGVEWMAEQMNLPRWNTDSDPNFKPGKYFCVANALISPQGWSIAFKDLEKLPGFKED